MPKTNRNSYTSIFKAIGLFGGVKVLQILFNIVKSKLIAVFIGPSGMGIAGLLQSTAEMVNQVTGCGLQTSAVREVSKSYEAGNTSFINRTITALRWTVLVTGLIGALVVFFGSGMLSQVAFGNRDYSTSFKYISIILIFNQLNVGQIALLQGTFHYKDLAKASLFGTIASLLIVTPIYYYLRERGIVPAIIAASLISLFFSWYFSGKVPFTRVNLSLRELLQESKGMIALGFVLAIGGMISTFSGYLMNIVLSRLGSVQDVGLYQAAFHIANSYVFLVLSAMATDYVPRLSAMSNNNEELTEAINKQMILVLLLLSPLLITFSVFAKEVIQILYSSKFFPIVPMMVIVMFGMVFRAVSWCMSYSLVARGESMTFLICELITCTLSLTLKALGFKFFGFIGAGVGFILGYVFYTLILTFATRRVFSFRFSKEFISIFIVCTLLVLVSFLLCMTLRDTVYKYIFGAIVLLFCGYYSFSELDKRIKLKDAIQARIHKITNTHDDN